MRKVVLVIIFGILVILSSATMASDNTEVIIEDLKIKPQGINSLSYTPHSAISILSDGQFDSQALAEGWPGSGNVTHPYIIEGYEIIYDGVNIQIHTTQRHFIIRNCRLIPDTMPGINMGIYLFYTHNAQIENVTVSGKGNGYYLYDSNDIVVTESKADNCNVGFYVRYCDRAVLSDLEAQTCGSGIEIRNTPDGTFDVGSTHDNTRGLTVKDSHNLQLAGLVVNDNTFEGIYIDSSNYCTLESTTIYTCGDNQHAGFNCTNSNYFTAYNITAWNLAQGFWIEDSFQPTIEDSYIHDGTQAGIAIWGCSETTISRTQVESNNYYGVGFSNSPTSLIEYCDIGYNVWNGISLYLSSNSRIMHSVIGNDGISVGYSEVHALDSDNLLLYNNSISFNNNENGVYLESSDFANLTRNTIYNNQINGVWIWDSDNTVLDNNTIYQNGDGIGLYNSHSTSMNDQNVHHNDRYGISTELSNWVTITDCDISFNIDNGVDVLTSNDSIVSHCQIYNNSFFGIRTRQVERIDISFCDIYWNEYDGLYMQNTENGAVSYNDFWENGGGDCEITLDNSLFALILGNTLIGNRVTQGIYVTWSAHANITGNTISGNFDDGLNIQNSNFTYIASNNILYNGKTGLYLWASSYATLRDNTIIGNNDFGVYISDCHYCTLDNNEISQNRLDGIYVYESHYLVIEFNDIFENGWTDPGNPRSGVYVSKSDNCTLDQNVIYSNTVHGVYLSDSHDCSLTSNIIYGNLGMTGPGCGVFLDSANGTIIDGNTIYDNIDDGIYGISSHYCEITGNDIYQNERFGIFTMHCDSWVIFENTVWNQKSSIGIHIQQCDYFVIDSNEVYDSPSAGIRFYLANYCNFTNNMVHHNALSGVQVDTSNGIRVIGNIIFDNAKGVTLIYANATWTYYNDIIMNTEFDGYEVFSTGQNYWDDNVSMGNWWWGISRTLDDYAISNSSETVNFDYYPMTSMWVDDAIALGYEITSTGNSVTWSSYAHNPDYYEVYDGVTLLGSGTWIGSDIIFSIDGLSAGIHDLDIRIYHVSGHYLTASVVVTVEDATAPAWVSVPTDQEIQFGEDLSYLLSATDESGISNWLVNDTVNFAITDGLLTNNVALGVGTYSVQITVSDPYGNELSVIITITVTESTTPPDGGMMLILIAAGGGLAVLVVIIVVVSKKKGG